MPRQFLLLLFFPIVLFFTNCEKKLDDRLLGKWGFSEKGYKVVNSIFTSDTTVILYGADINFKESGKGVLSRDTSIYVFEWATTKEEVTLTFEGEDPKTYTILFNSKDQQLWGFKDEEKGEENGISYEKKWRSTISLKKFIQ